MRRIVLASLLVLAACKKTESTSESPAAVATSSSWVDADPKRPIGAQLAEQAAVAVKAGHKPFAYMHASWCGPCKAIDATRRTDEKMKAAFAPTHIISIDIDAVDPAQMTALGLKSDAIPVFYRLDDAGKVTGASIDGGAWGDNIPENMAPPLAAFFAQ